MTTRTSIGRTPQDLTIGQLLCAFAYASDLAFGLQLEDSVRSCYLAVRLAQQMGLSEDECRSTYYTALLKDAGCTAWTTEQAGAWHTDEIVARRELMIFGNPLEDTCLLSAGCAASSRRMSPRREARPLRQRPDQQQRLLWRRLFHYAADRWRVSRNGLACLRSTGQRRSAFSNNGTAAALPNGTSVPTCPIVSRDRAADLFLVPFHRVSGRDARAPGCGPLLAGEAFDPAVVAASYALCRRRVVLGRIRSRTTSATSSSARSQIPHLASSMTTGSMM